MPAWWKIRMDTLESGQITSGSKEANKADNTVTFSPETTALVLVVDRKDGIVMYENPCAVDNDSPDEPRKRYRPCNVFVQPVEGSECYYYVDADGNQRKVCF